MCGLTGFLGFGHCESGPESVVRRMTDAIAHRGPDSDGHWIDPIAQIALGHRRLSIIDLSPAGAQPMQSPVGRFVIAFNGEIYNFEDLRSALSKDAPAPAWRGHSDTEVLLAGFEHWGIRATIEKAVGMFAFAVWDRELRSLTLGRDRLGEKPLYYGFQGSGGDSVFLFGSELKALRAHPAFNAPISRQALQYFVRRNNVPGALSIYEGISKLLPGHLLTVSLENRRPRIEQYWSALGIALEGQRNQFQGSEQESVDGLESILSQAIRQQMVSDVPLGAFLSGGVDSSTIVALMQKQSTRPVRTFSIGFYEDAYNEAEYAKAVANHLGTDHTELYVTAQQALDTIPQMPTIYDEPFADSSQIPTYLLSKLTRAHVTVSLSGDAGDELFGGYNRHVFTASVWPRIASLPVGLRRAMAWGMTRVSPGDLERWTSNLPFLNQFHGVGVKLHKAASTLSCPDVRSLYVGLSSQWRPEEPVVLGASTFSEPDLIDPSAMAGLDDVHRMMLWDMTTYLPDDILTKVDRATMASSLESRVPYLDHRVVEFAWRLPIGHKVKRTDGGVTSKSVLRQVLYRHVPRELIERPKMGFGLPVDDWLRGALRPWAEDLLEPSRLDREGYFDSGVVQATWKEHLSGRKNRHQQLWCILMFQAWLQEQSRSVHVS